MWRLNFEEITSVCVNIEIFRNWDPGCVNIKIFRRWNPVCVWTLIFHRKNSGVRTLTFHEKTPLCVNIEFFQRNTYVHWISGVWTLKISWLIFWVWESWPCEKCSRLMWRHCTLKKKLCVKHWKTIFFGGSAASNFQNFHLWVSKMFNARSTRWPPLARRASKKKRCSASFPPKGRKKSPLKKEDC